MLFLQRYFFTVSLFGLGIAVFFTNAWADTISRVLPGHNEPDVIIELIAKERMLDAGNGSKINYWSYHGKLIKGPPGTLETINGSYLGPTIEVNTEDKVRIIFKNELPEDSIIHWHGLDVSHADDGHPHNAIGTNEKYQYDFVVKNRAGMYWYHPHPHGKTGYQVYRGLAGLFIVRDQEEKNLNLPNDEQELNFVLQDRYFNNDGQLEYHPNLMMGAMGNTLFINGISKKKIAVKRGLYRVRLLNGSNARIFNIALDGGQDIKQIGSDGGLLDQINKLRNFYFAPSERLDFLLDFSNYSSGEVVKIEGLPLVEGRGEKYTIIEFEVTDEDGVSFNEPLKLSRFLHINPSEAVNFNNPKTFELFATRESGWTINGNGYEANRYEDYEIIKFGDTEIWEFYNPTGVPHPIHIHGTQFQILKRSSGGLEGSLDAGWKDTVLLMPGDRVRIIKRFNTFKGIFIYHCHNLEHEDMSMMRNFKITD